MTFSPLWEAIVLFSVPAVFWHIPLLQIAGRVSLRPRIAVSGIMLAWTAWAFAKRKDEARVASPAAAKSTAP